jgi:hypothetical protein
VRPQDLDDPTPPLADADVLRTVRNRGRSLQRRRRALRAATVAIVVVALGAGLVAITRPDGHRPTVSVEPTTTTSTPRPPVVYERFADDGGLHYSLLLHTPVVAPGATVRVELIIENRTDHVVNAGCDISEVTVFAPGSDRPAPTMPACHGRTTLASHGLQQDERETAAPSAAGRYLVALATSFPLPQSLLEPMDLQVVEPQPATRGCTSEVSVGPHPELPAPAGLGSIPGLTKISSDAGGLAPFKGKGIETTIAPECTYAVVGGIGQVWVSSAAVEQYGAAEKVPLPVPLELAAKHPGPVEVTLNLLKFRDASSAAALVHNPTYADHPEWTRLPDVSIAGGFVYKVYSAGNDGLDEFVVQRVVDHSWMEVAVLGAQLSAAEAVHVAESIVVSP